MRFDKLSYSLRLFSIRDVEQKRYSTDHGKVFSKKMFHVDGLVVVDKRVRIFFSKFEVVEILVVYR